MLEVKTNTIQLRMDDNNLKFSFGKGDTEWNWTSEYRPKMECKEGTVYFDEALEIHHELVQNGIGKGIRSSFAGFLATLPALCPPRDNVRGFERRIVGRA